MSAVATLPVSTERTWTRALLVIMPPAAILLAHAPLVVVHIAQQMARPHYQFVALLPIAVGALAWSRLRDGVKTGAASVVPLAALLIIALAMLSTARYLWSPWLGAAALLVSTLATIYWFGGWPLTRQLLPAWLLSCMMLPPPVGLDERLIVELRDVTTQWSSGVLDQLGILHLIRGNVIELPRKSLFVADACSGIHSLFVLVATALFLTLWMRRSILHGIALLTTTLLIVMIENITRIVAVALGSHVGFDISEGLRHEVLGILLFVFSLLLIASTDQLLLLLIPRWKRKNRKQAATEEIIDLRCNRSLNLIGIAVLIPFTGVGVAQLVGPHFNAERVAALLANNDFDFPRFDETVLPEQWEEWRREGYQFEERGSGNPMAQFGQQWIYQKNGTVAMIALDYPYPELHDLASCYSRIGWDVVENRVLAAGALGQDIGANEVARLDLQKDFYGYAHVLFTSYNREGEASAYTNIHSPAYLATTRFHLETEPCYQIQLFSSTAQPPTKAEEEELLRLFLHCRDLIQQECRQVLSEDSP